MARLAWLLALVLCSACGAAPTASSAPGKADSILLVQVDGLGAAALDSYLQRPAAQAKDRLLVRLDGARTHAFADIATDGETAAAALITQTAPSALSDNAPPLFDLVQGKGIAAGFPAGTQQAIEAADDAARVDAVLAAGPARLIAIRLTGLLDAQAKGGAGATARALGAIDVQLARLRAAHPDALLMIIGGSGAAPRQSLGGAAAKAYAAYRKDQSAEGLAKYLKLDPKGVHPAGGALRIESTDLALAQRIAELAFVRAVFLRDAKGLHLYDLDLKATRAVHPAEFADLPALPVRVERALPVGQMLVLPVRAAGFDFQVGAQPAKVARGGAPADESRVPVIFAGPMIRGQAPEQVDLGAVAATLRAARTGADLPLWRALSTRGSPAKGTPWAACRAKGDCAALVATTAARAPAADALVQAKAYAAARWLDPTVPLPEGANGSAPAPSRADRVAFQDEPKGFTPVDVAVPSAAHAAMIARAIDAEVVAWQDSAVVATPYLYALGGPAHFAGPLMEADGYAAFARGLAALRQADFHAAYADLSAAKGLVGEAEVWRAQLVVVAAHQVDDVDEKPAYPPAKGWPNVAVQALRVINSDDEARLPPLPMGMSDRQIRLYGAFARRVVESLPCTQVDNQARLTELADVQARFEEAGLLDFAALAALDRAELQADPALSRARVNEALDLAARPEAVFTRGWIYTRLLLTEITRPAFAERIDAELNRAAEAQLLFVQALIARDRARGESGAERMALLIDGGALRRKPELVAETVQYAIDGQSQNSAAVVQALLASSGIAAVLKPGGMQQIGAILQLMEQALSAVPAGDSGDDRVARAMPMVLKSVLVGLQGNLPRARAGLAAVNAQLPLEPTLAAREAALKAAGEDGDPSIAAWGPFIKAVVIFGQGVAAIMADDHPAASKHALEQVELIRRIARAELARAGVKGFEKPVDALAHVLSELARFVAASEDPAQAKAATQRMLVAARAFPLDVPDADPEVRPWLRLAGVLVHDLAWLLAQDTDPKPLAAPTAALDGLVAEWTVESSLGRAGLYLLLAAQHALPDMHRLVAADDVLAAFKTLTRVRAALKAMVDAVRKRYPADGVAAALKADKVERIFVEHVLFLAENPDRFDSDTLAESLAQTNARLRAAAQGAQGDVRPTLLLIESVLAQVEGDMDAAIRWAEEGAKGPDGPAFARLPGLWQAIIAGWQARKGDHKAALVALDKASKACPTLEHRFALARAVHRAEAGDKYGARDAFKAARIAGRASGNGGVDTFFQVNVQDDSIVLQTKIQTPLLGLLLGRSSGTFQLGAGGSSNDEAAQRTVVWLLQPQGSPADAVMEALALEAWTALTHGDQATAGTAMSHMMTLLFRIDPRHIDGQPAAGLPPMPEGPFQPRSARMIVWVGALAELHGFEKFGGWLIQSMAQRAEADWPDPPGGIENVCKRDLPDDAPKLADKFQCSAPAPLYHLLGADAAAAFERLVRARLYAPAEVPAARSALADAAPTLLPRPAPSREALKALRAGASDDKRLRAAIEGGYTCELALLAMSDNRALGSKLLGEISACGPNPIRSMFTQLAIADGNATTILEALAGVLEIERWTGSGPKVSERLWQQARKTMLGDKATRLAKRAEEWRALAERLEQPAQVAWFEALRIAATGDEKAAEPALVAAWQAGVRRGPQLRFLKRVMAGEFAAARKEILP